jgi:hypothetical protein
LSTLPLSLPDLSSALVGCIPISHPKGSADESNTFDKDGYPHLSSDSVFDFAPSPSTTFQSSLSSSDNDSFRAQSAQLSHEIDDNVNLRSQLSFPIGMDIARQLLLDHSSDSRILILGRMCDEGDNTVDGVALASLLVSDLRASSSSESNGSRGSSTGLNSVSGFGEFSSSLHHPMSWNKLFGPPIDETNSFFY